MTAILVRPLPFTVGANSGWNGNNPVSNLNIDHPAMVARSTGTTASFTVNLGSSQTIDTVALVGSNLPSNATVTVTAGSYASGATPAFVGVKDSAISTKTILLFSPVTTSSVTVQITTPSGTIEAQRLVVGKRVETLGINQNCEQTFDDLSVVETGRGFSTVEEYAVLPSWKAKMDFVPDDKWRNELQPLFLRVGNKRGVLFVPVSDVPSRIQHEAVFGRLSAPAKGEVLSRNNWMVSFSITGLAA
ncbi:hypothetical protein [Brevundimonas sp. NPDC058933]|uniref:hypothetical protein n=1 Tax=Brevundimonas sp. NPDC058933 TaxID=3346673 RepID=UPI003BEEC785